MGKKNNEYEVTGACGIYEGEERYVERFGWKA
jgi:hypothetical protein